MVARRHVGLDPDDRFDAVLGRLLAELLDPEQVAVIRDRDRSLAVGGRAGADLVDALRAVEQRVRRVVVQVYEAGSIIRHP